MPHAVEPFSLVLYALLCVDVFALTVSETILHLAIVSRLIWPLVTAHASNLIVFEFSSVSRAICPVELALSVKETVLQITFVRVPIPELARALSMEYFADLSNKLS